MDLIEEVRRNNAGAGSRRRAAKDAAFCAGAMTSLPEDRFAYGPPDLQTRLKPASRGIVIDLRDRWQASGRHRPVVTLWVRVDVAPCTA